MVKKSLRAWMSACVVAFAFVAVYGAPKYVYDSVPGDPLHTKIYTLPNGLKIFMSQNDREPRIQANISVRVGGKNDPAETTGLAHYFEHMMFKGTTHFGTMNYALEKPMLDEIESLFETYRVTTDSVARKQIYHKIDSISFEASKLAIPNEYDKMMSSIGSLGTNAFTSRDQTCYVENIPSNELDRWAYVQADRFKQPVLRGFHTELETIYEEKNMSLTKDSRRLVEKMFTMLFPSHPYGQQTVLGSQTHLKNPSITNIKKYHAKWYVPNNMAIALSGDFDCDEAVDIITRYFGDMKPNDNLQRLTIVPETPFTAPVRDEVVGNEAEFALMAWRIPEASNKDSQLLEMLAEVLSNGSAGIIDLDLNQTQKVQGAGASVYGLADQGAFILEAHPRNGQTLEELEPLMLAEIEKVRKGKFSNKLVEAVKANTMLDIEESFISNEDRVDYYVNSFVNGESWNDVVDSFSRIKKVTKADLVAVAKKYLGLNNYIVLNKRQGTPTDELKIAKPEITPIVTNRDTASTFLTDFVSRTVEPIEPHFVDFQHDLKSTTLANGSQLLYTNNRYNHSFDLTFIYETGGWANAILPFVAKYMKLVGTKKMSPSDISEAFYALACDFRIVCNAERSYVLISGLSDNMTKAVNLFETLVKDAVVDNDVFNDYVASLLKNREDLRANQSSNFEALNRYVAWGPEYVKKTGVTNERLKSMTADELLAGLRHMLGMKHRIIYYGPEQMDKVVADLNNCHMKGVTLSDPDEFTYYTAVETPETVIYIAPYDAKQLYMRMFSNDGEKFDVKKHSGISMYNEYFGGGMNSIVFQEMREARSLAYSAIGFYSEPSDLRDDAAYYAQIATQNDKLMDAIAAFNEIIENMPESEPAFELAKSAIDSQLRTARVLDDNIAWSYINAVDRGIAPSLDGDGKNKSAGVSLNRTLFEALPYMTLEDVVKFQQENVKGRKYHIGILGKIEDLDLDALGKLGKVVILSTDDIFGY